MTNPNTIPNPNPNLNPTPEYTPNTLQLLGWSPGSGAHVQPGGGFGGGHVQPFGLQGFDWNARDACRKGLQPGYKCCGRALEERRVPAGEREPTAP